MPFLQAGAAIIGGAISAGGAKSAAGAQAASSAEALEEQRRQYDLNRADLSPWRGAGTDAISRIRALLGIGPMPKNPDNKAVWGDLNEEFHTHDFENDPVTKLSMKYGLSEGRRGINNMARSRGTMNSGATLKALTRFGEDYAGTQANNAYNRFYADQDRLYNRLAGTAGTGQTAALNTAQLGAQNAQTVGNLITGAGNARGAAAIAGSNAIGGGITNAGNWWSQNQLLNRLVPQSGGSVGYVPEMVPGQFSAGTYG